MSNECLNAVFARSRARGVARLVLIAIADRANDGGYAYCSIDDLRFRTQASRSQIFVALTALEGMDELHIVNRGGRFGVNSYHLASHLTHITKEEALVLKDAFTSPESRPSESGKQTAQSEKRTVESGKRTEASGIQTQTVRNPDLNHKEPLLTPKEPKASLSDSWMEIEGLSEHWAEFEKHRKAFGKPLTEGARRLILRTLSERPHDACAALSLSIRRGWLDVQWGWYDKEQAASAPSRASSRDCASIHELTGPARSVGASSGIDRSRLDAGAFMEHLRESSPYLVIANDPVATLDRAPERAIRHFLAAQSLIR